MTTVLSTVIDIEFLSNEKLLVLLSFFFFWGGGGGGEGAGLGGEREREENFFKYSPGKKDNARILFNPNQKILISHNRAKKNRFFF